MLNIEDTERFTNVCIENVVEWHKENYPYVDFDIQDVNVLEVKKISEGYISRLNTTLMDDLLFVYIFNKQENVVYEYVYEQISKTIIS